MMKNSNSNPSVAIVITAAGSSTRMGGKIKKEYLPLNNGTVLSNCARTFLEALEKICNITKFIITVPKNGQNDAINALYGNGDFCYSNVEFAEGGDTRAESVFNALKRIKENENIPDYVIIHDGARPFVSTELIQKTLKAAIEYGAAAPGITPVDTQKEIDENGMIVRHLVRKNLTAIQTPQIFNFEKLYAANEKLDFSEGYTDDTEIYSLCGGGVKIVEGEITNKKITYPGDL